VIRFEIGEADLSVGKVEQRLGRFLVARLPQLSRMYIKKRFVQQRCWVNGIVRDAAYYLKLGDLVELEGDVGARTAMSPESLPLQILYEDEHLIVLVKPSGMLVHPTLVEKSGTLANALVGHWTGAIRPGFVHRLDQATSGVMVVAKSRLALRNLAIQFQRRQVEKCYQALVTGELTKVAMEIDAAIGRQEGESPAWHVRVDGKPAQTLLKRVSVVDDDTRVEMIPVTGRTNQLRIHCAHIGHPIVGDDRYGGRPAARLHLHAWRLAFDNPETGQRLEFEAPCPF
jgi:23S rRNA pseudouridine1911/1915/1917 synthase